MSYIIWMKVHIMTFSLEGDKWIIYIERIDLFHVLYFVYVAEAFIILN